MPIPKNTRGRDPALLFRNLACGRTNFCGRFGDCVLHEQIVIPFSSCKVLSKEQRSRLNK